MPKLYGVNGSPFVRKVLICATEKKIAFESEPVLPRGVGREGWEKIHPLKKIPVWEDGDLMIPDSSAICAYLERRHPSPSLYPGDPGDYGRAIWFEAFGDEGLVKLTAAIFFERVVVPMRFNRETNEETVRKGIEELMPPLLDYLEGQLGSDGWLVSGKFSIADIGTGTHFVNLSYAGVTPDTSKWPKTAAWVARFFEHPSVAPLIAADRVEYSGS